MILYIAGPMTGRPDMNYPAFRTAGAELRAVGYEVLNPADVDAMHKRELGDVDGCNVCFNGVSHTWEWYMRRTLTMVLNADGIAVLQGWAGSRGAMMEVRLSEQLGMPMAHVATWIERAKADAIRRVEEAHREQQA